MSLTVGVFGLTACASFGSDGTGDDQPVAAIEANESDLTGGFGDECGGFLGLTCRSGRVCIHPKEQACGGNDQAGRCFDPRVVRCATSGDGVCGCDGKSYANECLANSKGVSVAHDGACEPAPGHVGQAGDTCGGKLGLRCAADLACMFSDAARCGAGDMTGRCERVDTLACESSPDDESVCGCDGRTYANRCSATSAGASVRHAGACGA